MTHEQMTKLSKECNHNIESFKKYIGAGVAEIPRDIISFKDFEYFIALHENFKAQSEFQDFISRNEKF